MCVRVRMYVIVVLQSVCMSEGRGSEKWWLRRKEDSGGVVPQNTWALKASRAHEATTRKCTLAPKVTTRPFQLKKQGNEVSRDRLYHEVRKDWPEGAKRQSEKHAEDYRRDASSEEVPADEASNEDQ